MKVIIFRSGAPTYWYKNRIGESFLVEDFYDGISKKLKWRVVPNNGRVINKEDAEEAYVKPRRMLRFCYET